MPDSLIEQVKRLAEAHREHGGARTRDPNGPHSIGVEIDATSLLVHMQAQQAVVDAARKLDLDREDNNDGRAVGHWDASAEDALNAALEKESNGKG